MSGWVWMLGVCCGVGIGVLGHNPVTVVLEMKKIVYQFVIIKKTP